MLNYDVVKNTDDPYQYIHFQNIFPEELYEELMDNWPQDGIAPMHFAPRKVAGKKSSLHSNDPNSKNAFEAFISDNKAWASVYAYFKSQKFIDWVSKTYPIAAETEFKEVRFEFSHMPADGGHLHPHPDGHDKMITLCIYMPHRWDESWGGNFQVLKHKTNPDADFTTRGNGKTTWDECNVIYEVPFISNEAVMMCRSDNSLHAVAPMTGPASEYRTSLVINLIKKVAPKK